MKTKLLKLLAVMTISITAIFALGLSASAETVGAFEVTGGTLNTDYTYAGGVLTINTSTALTIKNTTPSTPTTDTIVVANGVSANITLAGVNIDVSSQNDTAAFKIADDSAGNVTITLADGSTNTLKSGTDCAGLQKNGAYISETQGKLTITGTGSLTATGGKSAAGIGGGDVCDGSNIEISGGTVTAEGGYDGAGIGGSWDGSGSYITISGGTITAIGGYDGAGIGGGDGSDGSNIEISGGTITAIGSEDGAGIGGGYNGSADNIEISGGTVTATGGTSNAGIGGGYNGSADNIKISGGSVKASSIGCIPTDGTANATPVYLLELNVDGTSAVTINGKAYPTKHIDENRLYVYLPAGNYTVANGNSQKIYAIADDGTVSEAAFTITGTALVYGTDYTYPADTGVLTILSGKAMTIANADTTTATNNRIEVADGVSANITLAGVNIDVFSLSDTAAFKIADNSAGNVTITLADGTTNTLISGGNCAGLQKNGEYSETLGKLTITGTGTLTATGGIGSSAGIGGSSSGSGSNITISGGTVTAQGGTGGAGIGGGNGGNGSYIEISGGVVTATGGIGSAGIGGGNSGSGSYITISGGKVTATSVTYGAGLGGGAGIGGGAGSSGSYIEISGGVVTATGSEDGAGIGGGSVGSGSYIEISGGVVTATGGDYGAGIGGGAGSSGSYIEISGGVVTATGGTGGAGIGDGVNRGNADNITISGGSVKAVAGTVYQNCVPAAIGQGVQYDSNTDVHSNGAEVTPTDGNGNNVYLFTLDNPNNEDIIINGVDYPDKHGSENKIYAYLPNDNHIVEIGDTTKYYIYKDGGYQCYNYADIWMDCERYSKPYDGIEIYISEFTVYLGDEDITDNENIAFTFYDSEGTLLGSSPVDVGEYTVRATYDDGETFGMAELEYEIEPGPLGTINIFGKVGKTLGETTKEYIPEGAPEPADPFAGTFAWADGFSDSTVIVAGKEYNWTFTAESSNYAVLEGTFVAYGDISAPTDFTATGGEGKVTLNWTSNSTAAAPYEAYSIYVFTTMENAEAFLHTSEQKFVKSKYFLDDADEPVTSYEIDKLASGTTYYFVLMADPMGKQAGTTSDHSVYATASDGTNIVSATTSSASSGGSGGSGGGTEGDVGGSESIPAVTTPSYTGIPSWVTTPSETTTTTTTTTTQPPVDEDIDDDTDDEDIEIDEDTDTTKPADGDEPQIKGDNGKTGWDAILDELDDADEGDKIVVDMNGETEVPEDVFEQIKGQDIDLVIELDNGFIWTINGKDVTNPADIDLGVNKGSTIPVRVINAVTGECEYITITLTHNGEFGFKAVLTVDMGDENEGLYANLYWYTSGNTEFICADKINNKGKADLTFTHASEYIIVIDETNHGKRVEESDNADEDADSDVDNIFNREEDDDVNPFTAVTISFTGVIISAATIMIARKRKKQ